VAELSANKNSLDWRKRGASLKSWFAPKNIQYTAIDLDGAMLRVAQFIRHKDRAEILRFAAKELAAPAGATLDDPQIAGAAIGAALRELRINASRAVMGLSRANVLLRSLTFPQAENPGELAAMVQFQFGKDLPFPADEAVIDFVAHREIAPTAHEGPRPGSVGAPNAGPTGETSPNDAGPKVEVLAAAVRKEVIEKYQQLARAAGVELAALGLRSPAHARCLVASGVASLDETVALILLRTDEITIEVLRNGQVLFSRSALLKPASTLDENSPETAVIAGAESLDPFVRTATTELLRTLHSYEGMERHESLRKLILVGHTGSETAMAAAFSSRTSLACEILEPAKALGLAGAEHHHASGALAVIGLGLGMADPQGLPFDFLHPKQPPVRRNVKRIRQLAAAAAIVLILGGAFALRSHSIKTRLKKKQELQQQLAAAQKNEPFYRQTRLQAKTVQDWLKENQPWLDHLAFLSAALPPRSDLYITSLSTSSRGGLQLSVQARTTEILSRLDKILRDAGYEVRPLAVTPTADKFGYPFKSSVELSVAPGKKLAFLQTPAEQHSTTNAAKKNLSKPAGAPGGNTSGSKTKSRRSL